MMKQTRAAAMAAVGKGSSSNGQVTLSFRINATSGPGLRYFQNAHTLHPDVTFKTQSIQPGTLAGEGTLRRSPVRKDR